MVGRKKHKVGARRLKKGGFTLIEVVIALMILAVSLTTLLSLLSSVVQRTIRGQREEKAMLAARSVLASIETNASAKSVEPFEGMLPDLLLRMNVNLPEDKTDSGEQEDGALASYQANLVVEPWGIATFPDALQRIRLVVSWGPTTLDRVTLDYFIPTEKDAAP